MDIKIVRIGNSRGVRLPKAILEQAGLADVAELTVEDGRIVLSAKQAHPRAGWAEAFAGATTDLGSDDLDWLDASLVEEPAA